MSTLALAMIVRDEAPRLPAFLEHHRPLVDEIVVVDTGSADGSGNLARDAGALVVDRPWDDDFSAARNAGLARVRSRQVLILDADERIAAADFERLRQDTGNEPGVVWILETRNYLRGISHLEWQPPTGRYPAEETGTDGYFAARRASLFPLLPDIRFSGRLHESVLPAAAEKGLEVRHHSVPIHHFGHLGDAGARERRRARDRRLAALKVTDTPSDSAARLEWGTILLEDGDLDAAERELTVAADGPPGLRPAVRARVLLGRLRREAGDGAAAGDLLEEAVRQDPDFLFGWLELVRLRADQDAWNEALDLVTAALARFPGNDGLLLRERMRCHAHTGRVAEAAVDAAALAERYPQWTEIAALQRRLAKLAGGS